MFHAVQCTECGDCLAQCQYVDYTREQAIGQIQSLKRGECADILKQCITCMACNEYCSRGANPYDLICAGQEQHAVRLIPVEMVDFIDKTAAGTPNQILPGAPGMPALSLCVMDPAYPAGITQSKMFEGLTLIKGSDYYSSVVCLHAGFESRVRARAQGFIDNLARLRQQEIIFMHNDCYVLAAKKAQEYGIAVPFRPVNIVQYMAGFLGRNPESITPLRKKIAFQRPCISRYIPEEEKWLDEFFSLIGVERLARQYDRKNALCCAAGLAEMQPDKALPIIEKNIDDAKTFGADAMVFLCPNCYWLMSGKCEELGMPSMFITDLCRMALGELPFFSRPWGSG